MMKTTRTFAFVHRFGGYPTLLVILLLAAGMLSACGKKPDTAVDPPIQRAEVAPPSTTAEDSNQPSPVPTTTPAFGKLMGKWLRPDGGYVIEIRGVEPGGKLDAGYFNPQSINVAKAEASSEGETVKVFVELRDVNYPGATYTLTYDPANDVLMGAYFQPTLQQTFDVVFERLNQ